MQFRGVYKIFWRSKGGSLEPPRTPPVYGPGNVRKKYVCTQLCEMHAWMYWMGLHTARTRLVFRMCRVPAYDINCREVVDATYVLRVDSSLFSKLETLMIHMTWQTDLAAGTYMILKVPKVSCCVQNSSPLGRFCYFKLDFTITLSSKYMQVLINLCGPNVCHGNYHNIFTCFMWYEHSIFHDCKKNKIAETSS